MSASRPPTRRASYLRDLQALGDDPHAVRAFLMTHSNLPGPRGNLELAHAFADWAPAGMVDELAREADEYLLFCAVLALGERLAHQDDPRLVDVLHEHARASRWRIREAVATGLQRVGDRDLPRLCALVRRWTADGDPLVMRAAVAAICEPRLLGADEGSATALAACAAATSWIAALPAGSRRDDDVRTLRQALGYCWSVAVAARPEEGLRSFEALADSVDADVAWIVRENLGKARLRRILAQPRSELGADREPPHQP